VGKRRELLTPFGGYGDRYKQNGEDTDWVAPSVEPQQERRPWSPIQALMEAAPHDEPETSQLELLVMRDVLADALDELDPRDRRLIEARVIEKRSLRSLEPELGWHKSYMDRRQKVVLARLAEKLQTNPLIEEYLSRT